jgi:hypothetical protein
MRNVLLSAIILCLFSTLTAAQIPTSGNVFFGYSYYNTDISGLGHNGLNGWQGSLEGKIFHGVGIVADLGGHYGSVPVVPPISPTCVVVPCPGGSPPSGSTHIYDALFGPRFSASFGRFRPFAEFEFGVSHVATSPLGSGTSFADAFGGGLDYRLIRPIAWRIQADYVQTRFFGVAQSNARISTGIVLRF